MLTLAAASTQDGLDSQLSVMLTFRASKTGLGTEFEGGDDCSNQNENIFRVY